MKTLRLDLSSLEVVSFTITCEDEAMVWDENAAVTTEWVCTRHLSCKATPCC